MNKFITGAVLGLAILLSSSNAISVEASAVSSIEIMDENIEVYKEIIDYRYGMYEGNLYRRLFNFSTNEWIGDWELVG